MDTALSPSHSTLAVSVSSHRIKLYDLSSPTLSAVSQLSGHTGTITQVSFPSPDHPTTLMSCARDRTVRLWDTRTGKETMKVCAPALPPSLAAQVAAHGSHPAATGVESCAVGVGGALLAAAFECSIGFWDIRGGGSGAAVGQYSLSHNEPVTKVTFHPTLRSHVASSSEDGTVCVFDSSISGEEDALSVVLSVGAAVHNFGFFGPKHAFVYAVTGNPSVSLWNVGSGHCIGDFKDARKTTGALRFVDCHFHEDHQRLTLAGTSATGDVLLADVKPTGITAAAPIGGGHSEPLTSFEWMPGGGEKGFVTGGEDGKVCVWRFGEGGGSGGGSGGGAGSGSGSGRPDRSDRGRGKGMRKKLLSPF